MAATEVTTRGGWLDSPHGPLTGWFSSRRCAGDLGVVILPPLGYETSSAYRTLRAFAEAVAERGARAVRVDYVGTGDSAGGPDAMSLTSLRAALPAAAAALRAQGAARIAVAGLRVGAVLAMLDADAVGADAVLAWAPVPLGRSYPRELRLVGEVAPPEAGLGPSGVLVAGHAFPDGLLTELASVTAADLRLKGVRRVIVADRDDRPDSDALLASARDGGARVEHVRLGGHEAFLDCAAEDAVTATAAAQQLADLLVPSPDAAVHARVGPPQPRVATVDAGDDVLEEHVVLGGRRLVAVRTSMRSSAAEATLVLLNSGSDPHHGPGRAWVDLARSLAPLGVDVVRVDFTGWGESPADPRATGRPYDLHTVEDVLDAVATLRAEGAARVIVAGLCAGAWIALQAARRCDGSEAVIDGVVALNPQLYWHAGDPVEALLTDTRRRRTEEIAAIKAAGSAGTWDAEDAAGLLPEEATWLQELCDAGLPVDLLFAAGDDGLVHLRDRLGRRVAALQRTGLLHVVELPGVDHGLTRTWLRPQVAAAFKAAVDRQGRITSAAR